jgi:hypothetical protein
MLNSLTNPNRLRVIKTARNKDKINRAAKAGLIPIIKLVRPSEHIKSKFSVIQNTRTGEIEVLRDYRLTNLQVDNGPTETVIGFTYYYPHHFESPFAAYLVPKDLQINERVFIEDLIDDLVGASWNQGDKYRLSSAEAIWNGQDLIIQFKEDLTSSTITG